MRRSALLVTVLALGLVASCANEAPSPTATPSPTSPAVSPTPSGPASCRAVSLLGEPLQRLPPVTADDWVRGPVDASITLIEYSDFQ